MLLTTPTSPSPSITYTYSPPPGRTTLWRTPGSNTGSWSVTDFKDTSKWEKKDDCTILYRYAYQGTEREGELEKEPHLLPVRIDRLSVQDTTAWVVADKEDAGLSAGFQLREYIKIEGQLDLVRLHAFTLDEMPTSTFDRIVVSIYPIALEDLQLASKYSRWSIPDRQNRPSEGWLQDEPGRLSHYEATEYFDRSIVHATLRVDQATFETLVQKIKNGVTIRSARLEILADLFQFGYEGAFGGGSVMRNYGLLCETGKHRTGGNTNARLEELLIEWAPKLRLLGDGETKEVEPTDLAIEKVAADVQQIRARLESLYQGLIFIVVIFVVSSVADWIGF